MKIAALMCVYMLTTAASMPSDNSIPCTAARHDDKEAVIDELICIENYNKNTVIRRNRYQNLLHHIKGEDGSDCLAIHCVNNGDLILTLGIEPSNASIKVSWGGNKHASYNSTHRNEGLALDFRGTIGWMPSDSFATPCQSNTLRYLRLSNNTDGTVTLSSIKLKLLYSNGSSKLIYEDNERRRLAGGDDVNITADDILNNSAYLKAAAGSCLDN